MSASNQAANANEQFDYIFKFIIIGDAGAGKSCILHQFIEGRPKKSSSHTIGVEFGSKIIQVGNNKVKLQIWDTAGQDRYRAVTRSYYRGAAGALIVYDITKYVTSCHYDVTPKPKTCYVNLSRVRLGHLNSLSIK